MAVKTYSTSDINFGSFDEWSRANFTNDTNITLSTVLTDAYPAAATPHGVSEIYNRSWFYGSIHSEGNGTVAVTTPYSSGASTGTINVKNVDYSVYSSIVFTAVATYPYTFSEWRTATGGGGTQIGTTAALTLTVSDHTSVQNFYAYFT